jgi:hypothetical protein
VILRTGFKVRQSPKTGVYGEFVPPTRQFGCSPKCVTHAN